MLNLCYIYSVLNIISNWDTGGKDNIFRRGSDDATIDLRTATRKYDVGRDDFVSVVNGVQGGFTIANGVIIENAASGRGDDTIIGNITPNTLNGRGGADDMNDSNGVNRINGGRSVDLINSGCGADLIHGGRSADVVTGGGGTFVFYILSDSRGKKD